MLWSIVIELYLKTILALWLDPEWYSGIDTFCWSRIDMCSMLDEFHNLKKKIFKQFSWVWWFKPDYISEGSVSHINGVWPVFPLKYSYLTPVFPLKYSYLTLIGQ